MRKNFKRKNYVLFGAIGIAAVALSSVGFATWITGMQQTTQDGSISVTVDTAENSTKYLDIALSDTNKTLHLGENITVEGQKISTANGKAQDLDIAFSSFQLIIGDKYSSEQIAAAKVKLEIKNLPAGITFTNGAFVPTNLYADNVNTNGESYLKLPANFGTVTNGVYYVNMTDVDDNDKSANLKGYTVKKPTLAEGGKLNFSWGTIFGNNGDSPLTYYNSLLEAETNVETKLGIMDTATKTLNHMHKLLNNANLTFTFTLVGLN